MGSQLPRVVTLDDLQSVFRLRSRSQTRRLMRQMNPAKLGRGLWCTDEDVILFIAEKRIKKLSGIDYTISRPTDAIRQAVRDVIPQIISDLAERGIIAICQPAA